MILIHTTNLRQTVVLELYCRNAECICYRLHTPHLPNPGRDCDKEYNGTFSQCCRMGHDNTKSTYVYIMYLYFKEEYECDSVKCMNRQNMSNVVSHERAFLHNV